MKPATNPQPSQRMQTLQILRFLAAFLVVIYHANIFVQTTSPTPAGGLMRMAATIGRSGVPIFFVISGFIMLHTSYAAFGSFGAAVRFARLRVIRIYPIYWILLGAYLLLNKASWADALSDPLATLGSFLLWPGQADAIFSVAWTLSFEMYFYLLFAVGLLFPRKLGLMFIAGVLLAGVGLGKVLDWQSATKSAEAFYGPELLLFLSGIGLGLWSRRPNFANWRGAPGHTLLFALTGTALLAISPYFRLAGVPAFVNYGVPAILLVASAIIFDAMERKPVFARLLVPLGDASYSLYLSHIPVMALGSVVLKPLVQQNFIGPWTLLLLHSLLAVVAGQLIYLIAERPLQRKLRHWGGRARLSGQKSLS